MQRFIDGQYIEIQKDAFDVADGIIKNSEYALPKTFYCGKKETYKCCFTHLVGLPVKPKTREKLPVTTYQLEIQDLVNNSEPQKYIINKARQIGFTEAILRVIQYEALQGKYIGGNVGIIAGTTAELSKNNLYRLYQLFRKIPYTIHETKFKGNKLHLTNGTVIKAFNANEEAFTGDTNYRCIFIDESAKWRLSDDSPVFNSILPIVETNGSDLFVVSTPKGPQKKFYEIWNENNPDWVKLQYDIWAAEGQLYTKSEIEDILAHSTEDINQEYLCKFTVGRNSIFSEYENTGNHEEIEL